MKTILSLLLATTFSGMTACASSSSAVRNGDAASARVEVSVLYASMQCGREEPDAQASWVSNAIALQHLYDKFPQEAMPTIDFDRERVVLMEMGLRPTLGYRLALVSSSAKVEKGSAEVLLEWIAPGRDMMVGQMLTSPCLLLKLERGSYQQVRFSDQSGVKKATLVVPL
ncbi:MAG: protease complex subunit PrcB family protein [Gammaproteobacteria bacterium]|nr:protease complex subunit PrcB family protein [Gammaproteobacteria bacterium]